MNRKRTHHTLRLENLESRQMMAGDVSSYAINRILYINGDANANGVALVDDGSGNINVVGITQGGSATTVNGGASQVFTKIKDVVISMGKGDDAVVVTDVALNGNLFISGGKDNDAIGLGEFADTGLIDDAVDTLLGALSIKKSLIIDGSDGDDALMARATTITKSLTVAMGLGNDTVTFDSSGGSDGVTVLKTATFSGGTGDDNVSLERLTVTKSLSIATHSGDDSVTLDTVSAKSLGVSLGALDDDVTVSDSTVTKTASFNGESGINTFTDGGGNSFGKLTQKNFQTIV